MTGICGYCRMGWRRPTDRELVNFGKSGYLRTLCEHHQREVRLARRVADRAARRRVPAPTKEAT